jgi:hypothetical protein
MRAAYLHCGHVARRHHLSGLEKSRGLKAPIELGIRSFSKEGALKKAMICETQFVRIFFEFRDRARN